MVGFSITKKLVISFTVLFILFAGFGAFNYYSVSNMNNESINVNDWTESQIAVSNISENLEGTHRAAIMRVLMANTPEAVRWRDKQIEYTKKTDEAFEAYQEVLNQTEYDDEQERQSDQAQLDAEKQRWQTYKNLLERLGQILISGDREGSVAMLSGEATAAFEQINAAMDQDIANCNDGIAEAIESSAGTYNSVVKLIIVIVVVVMVLIAIVLYALVRDIRKPVAQIVSVTKLAAQGDLSRDVVVDSSDEFHVIAENFNAVIKHIRKVLSKIQIAAQEVSTSAENLHESSNQTALAVQDVAQSVSKVSEHSSEQMASLSDAKDRVHVLEKGVDKVVSAMSIGLKSVQDTAHKAVSGSELASETVKQMIDVSETVEKSANIVQQLGDNSNEKIINNEYGTEYVINKK